MMYLTGVRWGKSERTFAVVLPAKGDPVWVLPGFEEMRARELIQRRRRIFASGRRTRARTSGSPAGLKDRGVATGRVGIEEAARFFVFDGVRKLAAAPKLDYVSAQPALKAAGVDLTPPPGRGGRKQ